MTIETNELLKKIDVLEKKLNKAEDAIKEAYWKCENCYKGVCQYCLNSGVKCYMQRNKVESVGKLKDKLDIAVKALKEYTIKEWAYADEYNNYPLGTGGWYHAHEALKQIKDAK